MTIHAPRRPRPRRPPAGTDEAVPTDKETIDPMMGKGHAVLGAATWTAGAAYALPAMGYTATPAILLMGCLPVAGAALRPDIDHPSASIAQSGGFITKGIAAAAGKLSGGHRQGTHRLWFLLVCAGFDFAVVTLFGRWGGLALFFVYTAFGTQALAKTTLHRGLGRRWKKSTWLLSDLYSWAFAAAASYGAYLVFPDAGSWWWLAAALTVGHLSHLIGDSLTTSGLEWAHGHRIRLPLLGNAGSRRESLLISACMLLMVVIIASSVFGVSLELPTWDDLPDWFPASLIPATAAGSLPG
jgi:membrane-bound metal-dependent hydrolase YbcI (DUF457 family)